MVGSSVFIRHNEKQMYLSLSDDQASTDQLTVAQVVATGKYDP